MIIKNVLLITIALLYAGGAQAQCINNITTNPDNSVNAQIPEKRNTFFDWRQSVFTVNNPLFGTGIYSPFYQSGNIPINHFLFNRDYNPSDGWELLAYDFGINENGTPKPQIKSTVNLVLYNKYTGIMRVFFAADRNEDYNGASVQVYLSGSTVPSLLNEANSFSAVDNFTKVILNAPAQFQNDRGQWLYADFFMTYDPCTCQNIQSIPPKIYIKLNLIKNSLIKLNGKITGTITSIENNQGTVTDDKYSISNLDPTNPKKAYSTFKDMNKFANEAITIASKNPTYRNVIDQFTSSIKSVGFIKSGLKAFPFIAPALELFDLFTGGGRDAGPQEVKVMPMAITADVGLSGTLETTLPFGAVTMAVPGAMDPTNYVASEYPYYNEVLGVFGLLSTPIYEFSGSGGPTPIIGRGGIFEGWDFKNVQRRLKIITPLRYAVNPASRLDVQDIMVQVIIRRPRLNKLDSTIYISALRASSLISEFVLDNGSGQVSPRYSSSDKLFVKLFVNLKRKDSNPNAQNVLHVLSYPAQLNPSSFSGWVDQFDNSYKNPEYTSLLGFSQNLSINNSQNVTVNIGAKENVIIASAGTNITVTTSNNSQVLAGSTISISSGVTITAGLALRTISGERNDVVYPQSNDVISSFCNSTSYKIQQRNLRKTSDNEQENSEGKYSDKSFAAFPNPASSKVSFRYYLEEPTQVRLNLFSTTGTVVATPVDAYQEAGPQEVSYDASHLPAGVYIYTLETSKGKETQRLVIIK